MTQQQHRNSYSASLSWHLHRCWRHLECWKHFSRRDSIAPVGLWLGRPRVHQWCVCLDPTLGLRLRLALDLALTSTATKRCVHCTFLLWRLWHDEEETMDVWKTAATTQWVRVANEHNVGCDRSSSFPLQSWGQAWSSSRSVALVAASSRRCRL